MTDTVWLFLNGEFPRIGTGRRRVEVITRGWKYVTVRYHPIHSLQPKRQRIRRALFDRLTMRGKDYAASRRKTPTRARR